MCNKSMWDGDGSILPGLACVISLCGMGLHNYILLPGLAWVIRRHSGRRGEGLSPLPVIESVPGA